MEEQQTGDKGRQTGGNTAASAPSDGASISGLQRGEGMSITRNPGANKQHRVVAFKKVKRLYRIWATALFGRNRCTKMPPSLHHCPEVSADFPDDPRVPRLYLELPFGVRSNSYTTALVKLKGGE